MSVVSKSTVIEYGDYQTPMGLAHQICNFIARLGLPPSSIVEPTCGSGNFLVACEKLFDQLVHTVGFDINPQYVDHAQKRVPRATITAANFFELDWNTTLDRLPDPILVIEIHLGLQTQC